MKRYILHTLCLLVALIVTNRVWGQLPATSGSMSGSYKLTANVTLTGEIRVADTKILTIDLNGFTITNKTGGGFMFVVSEGTELIIMDTKGGGKITGGRGDRGGCALVSGTLRLQGGTIENCISTDGNYADTETSSINYKTQGCGGAFFINQGAKFYMSGGSIKNCRTEIVGEGNSSVGRGGAVFVDAEQGSTGGYFEMTGGTIEGCKANLGGAVYVHESLAEGIKVKGKFKMTGGIIQNNKACVNGCGVYANGDVEMSGTAIIQNNTPTGWNDNQATGWSLSMVPGTEYPYTQPNGCYGGGVYINGNAVFNMSGGEIKSNQAESGGGVMVWTGSTFNMSGGTISGNYAIGQGGLGNGGAVYVQTGTFDFTGGTLTGNTAVRYGGAVNINQSAIFNLTGECNITGNKSMHGGAFSQEQGACNMSLTSPNILIQNNTAHGYNSANQTQGQGNGGGIFIEKGELTISAGQIKDNKASGRGGGASLYVSRIEGDITVNVTGGTISGNQAGVSGGGLDLYASPIKDAPTNEDQLDGNVSYNTVLVNFNDGVLNGNSAPNGGGIYVGIKTTANSSGTNNKAVMNVGTNSLIPEIYDNTVTENGGALGMNQGTFNVIKGNMYNNHATNGNGGAIYLGAGEFNITGEATISGNSAKNGGAICVENGTVTINKGILENNVATLFGGGLYVYNSPSSAQKNVKFSGGTLKQNEALIGGGACVNGNIKLEIDATIEENEAHNGGAIYMMNGVNMAFGNGLIRSNTAIKKDGVDTPTTVYHATTDVSGKTTLGNTTTQVYGVGGGIFMDSGTTLTFSTPEKLGIYNNHADAAADDIFANGNSTVVVLPSVEDMQLKEFDVPGNELYWVEDYMKDEQNYSQGTEILTTGGVRYQDALKEKITPGKLENDQTHTLNATNSNSFACLSLGYDLVFVKFVKKGLLYGDDVIFEIYYPDKVDPTKFVLYRKLIVTGIENNADVEKTIALPSGEWKFKETMWNWKYDVPTYLPAHDAVKGTILITRDSADEITVTNTIKDKFAGQEILEFEHRKENRMKP